MIVAQTEWVVPTEYPDLRSANEIAIDLETRDPNLKETGSGAIAGGGVNGPDDVKMAKKARKKYKTQNKIDAANYHGGIQHYVNQRFNGIK